MKQLVFAVFDEKAQAYMSPIFVNAPGLASRLFQDAVNDPQSPFSKHPEDYNLYQIGFYWPESGKLEGLVNPEFQFRGSSVVKNGGASE